VAIKRDEKSLSGLNSDEWLELGLIVKKLENAAQKAFHPTMFNWGCLMNSSYLEDPPSPHLHWHFIPRYRESVVFKGKTFEDPCFGMSTMHDRGRSVELTNEFKELIKEEIIRYFK